MGADGFEPPSLLRIRSTAVRNRPLCQTPIKGDEGTRTPKPAHHRHDSFQDCCITIMLHLRIRWVSPDLYGLNPNKHAVGIEPTNDSFADYSLSHLGTHAWRQEFKVSPLTKPLTA